MSSGLVSNAKLVSLAIAVFFFAATYIALGYSASSPPADARKIMDDVYRQDTSRDATMRATLEVFDKEGQGRKKRFTCRRIGPTGDSKTLVVFSDPEEIRGVALLSINQQGVRGGQFIYT